MEDAFLVDQLFYVRDLFDVSCFDTILTHCGISLFLAQKLIFCDSVIFNPAGDFRRIKLEVSH